MLLPLCSVALAWDSHLTDAVMGEANAKRAQQAEAEGADHWEEVGVGISPEGKPYTMGIARGKRYEHIEAGLFLVASARIEQGIFARSVNLVISHDENGSLALMVNKPATFPAAEHLAHEEVLEEIFGEEPVRPGSVMLAGGPVPNPAPYFLHSGAPTDSSRACYREEGGPRLYDSRGNLIEAGEPPAAGLAVVEGVFFSASRSWGRCALTDRRGPTVRASVGHAGWGASQLDGEYRRGDWLLCKAEADLVFGDETQMASLWKTLLYSPRGMQLCSQIGADMA